MTVSRRRTPTISPLSPTLPLPRSTSRRHHRAAARDREHVFHRAKERFVHRALGRRDVAVHRRHQLRDALVRLSSSFATVHRISGADPRTTGMSSPGTRTSSAARALRARPGPEARVVHHVALVREHHDVRHADLTGRQDVLTRLEASGRRRPDHRGSRRPSVRPRDHVLHVVPRDRGSRRGRSDGCPKMRLHVSRRDRDASYALPARCRSRSYARTFASPFREHHRSQPSASSCRDPCRSFPTFTWGFVRSNFALAISADSCFRMRLRPLPPASGETLNHGSKTSSTRAALASLSRLQNSLVGRPPGTASRAEARVRSPSRWNPLPVRTGDLLPYHGDALPTELSGLADQTIPAGSTRCLSGEARSAGLREGLLERDVHIRGTPPEVGLGERGGRRESRRTRNLVSRPEGVSTQNSKMLGCAFCSDSIEGRARSRRVGSESWRLGKVSPRRPSERLSTRSPGASKAASDPSDPGCRAPSFRTLTGREKWGKRFEPATLGWKGDAQPLSYSRSSNWAVEMVEGEGFEPSKAYAGRFTVCSRWPLGHPPPPTPAVRMSSCWADAGTSGGARAGGRSRSADERAGEGTRTLTTSLQMRCSTTELRQRP